MIKWLKGLNTRKYGNSCLGIQWTFRNVGDYKSEFTRRYIRVHIFIFNGTMLFEYRFSNSI